MAGSDLVNALAVHLRMPVRTVDFIGIVDEPHLGIPGVHVIEQTPILLSGSDGKTSRDFVFLLDSGGCEIVGAVVADDEGLHGVLLDTLGEDVGTGSEYVRIAFDEFLNPAFVRDEEHVKELVVLSQSSGGDSFKVIGIVLMFQIGVRLALHVYDDARLSVSMNDGAEAVIRCAEQSQMITVSSIALTEAGSPHFSSINWFDWVESSQRRE